MSLEAILATIETSGEAEVTRLRAEAGARVRQILAEAEQTAALRREEARREALRPGAGERARRLHHARLEALLTVGEVRDGLVQTALAEARTRLASLRDDQDYPLILRCLMEEAIRALGDEGAEGGQCRLEVDPRDEALVRRILEDLDLSLESTPCLDCLGGVVARSADGRIVATNTLEARFERAMPCLRRNLALFFETEAKKSGSRLARLELEKLAPSG